MSGLPLARSRFEMAAGQNVNAMFPRLQCAGAANIFLPPPAPSPHHAHMGKRREARERAVQFLFQHDLNPPENLDESITQFWESQRWAAIAEEKGPSTWGQVTQLPPPNSDELAMRQFAEPLIRGVLEHRDAVDEQIRKYAQNWDMHRMAAVDRNILRLAIYEM